VPIFLLRKNKARLELMKKSILIIFVLLLSPVLASATVIKLTTGDEIISEIIEQTEASIKVKHDVLGELTINRNDIISINDAEPSQIKTTVSGSNVNVIEEDRGLFGTGLIPKWQRSFTLGLDGKKGNSNALDFHTEFDAEYEDNAKRWDFGIHYNYSEEDSEITHDDLNVFVTRDWLQNDSQWLYFFASKFDWDRLESWDYRLTAITGVGYEFIEEETFSLTGRAGLAGKKNFGSDDDDFKPELMLGLDTDWAINERQSLTFKTEFFTAFEQTSKFRSLSRLDWKIKLDSILDLSLKLGLENEYESVVGSSTKHNDFKYRAAIVWGL